MRLNNPGAIFADYPRLNRVFTLLCFAAPPLAGSAVSVLFNGGGLFSLVNVLRGKIALPDTREARIMSALFVAFVAAGILSALVNGSLFAKPSDLVKLAPFALFPFSYASWSMSRKDEIADAAVNGAAIACIGALLIGVLQEIIAPGTRAEGGAGNALVFATVMVIAISVVVSGLLLNFGVGRIVLALALACGAVALVLSQSRIPMVLAAVNVLLLTLVFGSPVLRRLALPAGALALAAFAAALIAGIQIPYISGRVSELVRDVALMHERETFNTSLGVRVAIWDIGLDMWRNAPWFGYGRDAAARELASRLADAYDISRYYTHFHNFIVQALVQGGIVTLASIVALFAYALRLAARAVSAAHEPACRFGAALILIVIVTYVGAGMTNIMFGHDILDAVFMVMMVPGVWLATGRMMTLRQ